MFPQRGLFDRDGTRLIALCARDEQGKHAVAIFRFDAIGVDRNGKRQRAIEITRDPLAPMDADILGIIDGLLAADADGVSFA